MYCHPFGHTNDKLEHVCVIIVRLFVHDFTLSKDHKLFVNQRTALDAFGKHYKRPLLVVAVIQAKIAPEHYDGRKITFR